MWFPPFVGRDRFRQVGAEMVAEAEAGRTQLLCIAGAAGIGKTTLAERILEDARGRGALTAVGRCDDELGAPAFWPWIEVFRGLIEACQSLPDELPDGLASLLASPVSSHTPSDRRDRFLLFDGAARFLERQALQQPLVLLLEDLHRADPSSLMLLQFLVHHVREAPLLMLGTFRSGGAEAEQLFEERIAGIARAPYGIELPLDPLSDGEVARLVESLCGAAVSRELVSAVVGHCGGNPLYVVETLRGLQAGSVAGLAAKSAEELPIPSTVRAVIRASMEALPKASAALLQLGSAVGRDFCLSVVGRAAGISPQEWSHLMEDPCRAGLVEELRGERLCFRFRHLLFRETVYDSMSRPERLRNHLQIARTLEELSGDEWEEQVYQLAHHYREAAELDSDGRGAFFSLCAAERASAGMAYERAASEAERALEMLELSEHDAENELRRCDALFVLATARRRAGDYLGCREAFFRLGRLARSLADGERMAGAALGFFESGSIGTIDLEWVELAEEALRILPDEERELRAQLLAMLSVELVWGGERRDARELADRGWEIAQAEGRPGLIAMVLDWRIPLVRGPDNPERTLAQAEQSIAMMPPGEEEEIVLRAKMTRHDLLLELGRFDEAGVERRSVFDWIERLGLFWSQRFRCMCWLMEGELESVDRFFESALGSGLLRLEQGGTETQCFISQLWSLRRFQDRASELLPLGEFCIAEYPNEAAFRTAVAVTHAEAGDPDAVLRTLGPILAGGFAALPRNVLWLTYMTQIAEALVVTDDLDSLRALRTRLQPYARRVVITPPSVGCSGALSHYLALVSDRLGDWRAARGHFEDALRVNKKLGKLLHAETAVCFAAALTRRGEEADRARALAEESRAAGIARIKPRAQALLQ
ncbi:MAG: AAA family ATPase [Deltaproteobacteria bacterium]|nr:AAA family ATPase [Deltaproteobacteria bacterium]MBW2419153.1 AAA family ATPase [Deltaproteobacteria bacterium]